MKNIIFSISIITMAAISSYAPKEKADLVIINGKIFTVDEAKPIVQAIAIKGENIIAVGTTSEISALIEKNSTKIINAGGRLVMPGFNDAHVHFGPLDPDYIELRYITEPSVITEKVKAQVAKSKPAELILENHSPAILYCSKNTLSLKNNIPGRETG